MTRRTAADIVYFLMVFAPAAPARAEEWHRRWEMEDRVARSQLILAARVVKVGAQTVVRGAKVDQTLREYRFQPVRVLKGVFSRDELIMTSSDLGLPEEDGSTAPPIREGEIRLLLLARQEGGFGCVSAPSGSAAPEAQIPLVGGAGDSVTGMVEDLVKATEATSRKERARRVLEALSRTSGPAAVPLLSSLSRRAGLAESGAPIAGQVARLMDDPSPAVRAAALEALARSLGAMRVMGVLGAGSDLAPFGSLVPKLERVLRDGGMETAARISALRSLGRLREVGRQLDAPGRLLAEALASAPTRAERVAAAEAIADLGDGKLEEKLLSALDALPLDEDPLHLHAFARAAVRLAGARVVPHLARRIDVKVGALRPRAVEVLHLVGLEAREAMPALLRAAESISFAEAGIELHGAVAISWDPPGPERDVWVHVGDAAGERYALARAFEHLKDERAVPVLALWLREGGFHYRDWALKALEAINTPAAIEAVRPRFKAEPDLRLKMRMARLLGRHGIRDGYAMAIEHIADPGLTALAADALGAIADSRSNGELWKILETSHDRGWNGAAILGLAALGDEKVKPRVLAILANPRDPLVASAVRAAERLGDAEALRPLASLARSRNAETALTAVESLGKLLPRADGAPPQGAPAEAGAALIEVLSDPDAPQELRLSALEALAIIGDPRLPAAAGSLADQVELEGSQLLARIEERMAGGGAGG